MRLVVAAIGRLKEGPERELAERYRKRAEQTGRRIGFRDIEVVEIRESRAQEVGKRMIEESIALAKLIPDKAVTIILDERGESLDSATLANRLGRWRDDGRPAAVFIIGGDDGLAPSLRDKARLEARLRRRHLAASAGARACCWSRSIAPSASFPGIRIIARKVAFAAFRHYLTARMSASERMTDSSRALAATLGHSRCFSLLPLLPPIAQSALDALRQRDQELEAIRTEQKKASETQAKLQERDRRHRRGPPQAQPGADRHRGAPAQRRGPDRRNRSAAQAARRQRAARSAQSLDGRRAVIAEVLAALAAHRPPPAARDDGPARRMRCSRCAPPSCSARWCRRCGMQAEALAADLADLVRIRKEIAEREGPARRATSPRSPRNGSASPC